MRTIITTLVVVLLTTNIYATRQTPDRILYEGVEYGSNSRHCPQPQLYMEEYFKNHPEKRPAKQRYPSTALWRGYVAKYEIKDSLLILNDILVPSSADPNEMKSVGISFSPDGSNLVIDWYTGVIVLSYIDIFIDGKRPSFRSLIDGDIETILLQIEKGKLTCVRKLAVGEYEEFKKKQLEAFRKTDKYEQAVEDILARSEGGASRIDFFMDSFLMYYSGRILVED
jgi:hypothetical protein